MPPEPFLHEASGAVRFWVLTRTSTFVGASIDTHILHYLYDAGPARGEPVALYLRHRREIDEAVRRRCAGGSIEPVMVREADRAPLRPA